MLVLGLILILIAAGVVLGAVAGSSNDTATFDLGGFSVEMSPLLVFLTGAATVLLLVFGLSLMRAGVRSASKRRKEKKELNRLAQKLEAKEQRTEATPGAAPTTATEPTIRSTEGDVTGPDQPSR